MPKRLLVVDPHVATEIGLNAALVLAQLRYLCDRSTAQGPDDRKWTYQSVRGLQETYFPFLGKSTVARALTVLTAGGYLEAGAFNTRSGDKTRWYVVSHSGTALLDGTVSQAGTGTSQSGTPQNQIGTPASQIGTGKHQIGTTLPGESLRVLPESPKDGDGAPAPAREEVSSVPAKPKRENPDTPWGRLSGWFFEAYPPELETFAGARDRIAKDLRVLLTKCKEDDAEAKAAVSAFSTGMEGGERPDLRLVNQYIGRWRMAASPTTFHPFDTPRKETTRAQRILASSGLVTPHATDAELDAVYGPDIRRAREREQQYQAARTHQQQAVCLPDGRPAREHA